VDRKSRLEETREEFRKRTEEIKLGKGESESRDGKVDREN